MTDDYHPDLTQALQRELAMAQLVSGLDHIFALLPQAALAPAEELQRAFVSELEGEDRHFFDDHQEAAEAVMLRIGMGMLS